MGLRMSARKKLRVYRVGAILNRTERSMLRRVRRYVKAMSGYDSDAEALRFLIRDWSPR